MLKSDTGFLKMSFAGLEKLAPKRSMGLYAGPAPISPLLPMEYISSNGFRLKQLPVTEESIHRAIDSALPDSDEYWALIEYLAWFTEKFSTPKTVSFYA